MSWTTGLKLYQKFPMHLTGYHLDMWEQLAAEQAATVDGFNETLQTFKTELLQGYMYEDQMDYLRSLKKPGKMEPSQFLPKLRAANRMATQLPDAPDLNTGSQTCSYEEYFLQPCHELGKSTLRMPISPYVATLKRTA